MLLPDFPTITTFEVEKWEGYWGDVQVVLLWVVSAAISVIVVSILVAGALRISRHFMPRGKRR